MRIVSLLLCVAAPSVVGVAFAVLSGASSVAGLGEKDISRRLRDPNDSTRLAVVAEVLDPLANRRKMAIDQLMAVLVAEPQLADSSDNAPKLLAMNALAQLKAVESTDLLVGQVTYRAEELVGQVNRWEGRPAVRALVALGVSSGIRVLRNQVLTDATPDALEGYALVLRYVFPDAKTAKAFVDAYDPGYTPEARAKLDELKKELAKLP